MKLKQNLFLKVLAFLLALIFFAAAGAMAIYQAANFNVLWEGQSAFRGYTNQRLCWRAVQDIQEMLNRRSLENPDSYSRRRIEELETAYSTESTNLRWVVRYGGLIVHGNGPTELPMWMDSFVYNVKTEVDGMPQPAELILWLDPELPVHDDHRIAVRALQVWRAHRAEFLAVTGLSAVLGILCTVYLCVTCGHKRGKEGIYLNWFHHIPGDVLLAAWFLGFAGLSVLIVECFEYYNDWPFRLELAVSTACIAGMAFLVISFFVTFVARCKGRALLRHTLIGWICIRLWRICRAVMNAIPLVWRVALTGVVYIVVSLVLTSLGWYDGGWMTLWVVVTVALLAYLCWWALRWKRIRQGAHEIISGNTDHHIDSSKMPPDLRDHANELNNLGQAIGAAVEERMRSEHFKAELITNVSHDLKTPLTSIINYVDLLKKEDIDNAQAREYIEVLDRKSQRLKKLTEDLVEASKASTGAVTVRCERLDLIQLVDQALAEYEDKLSARGLTVVRTLPADPVWVMADGRHLWRVMDNLLSNCAKYALEGTRVYVEVQSFAECAKVLVKNISREGLNISAERLTERFVRGDESRTMEGSGLGLSIARSLTELQQGSFSIVIDGDLFKAAVVISLAPPTELL